MAIYSFDRAKHARAAPSIVDTLNFNTGLLNNSILLVNRSSTPDLYFTTNASGGSTAAVSTVEGDETYVVPAGSSVSIFIGWAVTQIKVIASSSVDYSIQLEGV